MTHLDNLLVFLENSGLPYKRIDNQEYNFGELSLTNTTEIILEQEEETNLIFKDYVDAYGFTRKRGNPSGKFPMVLGYGGFFHSFTFDSEGRLIASGSYE